MAGMSVVGEGLRLFRKTWGAAEAFGIITHRIRSGPMKKINDSAMDGVKAFA